MIGEKHREYYAGGSLILIGLGSIYVSPEYGIGGLTDMGPGFFPFALGVLLAFMGVLIAIAGAASRRAARVEEWALPREHEPALRAPDWRGLGCIVASVLCFIVLAEYAGLLAAAFACVFVACFADRTAKLKDSLFLASGITIFGITLFWWILDVQIPLVRGGWR